jgi:hypothetical protein
MLDAFLSLEPIDATVGALRDFDWLRSLAGVLAHYLQSASV